jgi:hypothetical protein
LVDKRCDLGGLFVRNREHDEALVLELAIESIKRIRLARFFRGRLFA